MIYCKPFCKLLPFQYKYWDLYPRCFNLDKMISSDSFKPVITMLWLDFPAAALVLEIVVQQVSS